MISAFAGFLAGAVHVYAGPDHLAAVAPFSVDGKRRSWIIGFRWGLGHAGGVIAVGLLSLLLREALPIESLSSWAERLVGVVLIGIGLWGLRKAFSNHIHAHPHTHDGHSHVHIHVHSAGTPHHHGAAKEHSHTHAAFAIGTLHGLAGSSHFLGVLPSLALPTTFQAVTYLAAYGLGTVLAMISFAAVIGWLAQGFQLKGGRAYQSLMSFCSVATVAVGVWWLAAAF